MKRSFLAVGLASIIIFGTVLLSIRYLTPNPINDYLLDTIPAYNPNLITLVLLPLLFYSAIAFLLLIIWQTIIGQLSRQQTLSVTTLNTMNVLGRLVIIPFCVIAYLNTFAVFQGTLIGVAALFGTAVGFASTNTIGNFLAGIYILIIRPFSIGDYIILPSLGTEGVVREITINYTKIEMPTGNTSLFTNNSLLGQQVINTRVYRKEKLKDGRSVSHKYYHYGQTWGLPVSDSHEVATKAITEIADQFSGRAQEPITWFVLGRDKWERRYQLNILVKDASIILSLTSEIMTELSRVYERHKLAAT